jgi:hypothetical protein
MNESGLIKDLETINKQIERVVQAFPLLAVFVHMREARKVLEDLIVTLKNERALKK